MSKTLQILAGSALFLTASCTSTENSAAPVESGEGVQASTETVEEGADAAPAEEELDPNDPNVMVCPVTGIMQRVDDPDSAGHHGGDSGAY